MAIAGLPGWKLEDAKARFSEVVRRARHEGPQRVTYRGTDAVVVVAVGDFKRLLPAERPRQSLASFLRDSALGEIDTARVIDRGPYVAGRQWDLTEKAARKLGMTHTATVYSAVVRLTDPISHPGVPQVAPGRSVGRPDQAAEGSIAGSD
ncbi:MAG: type II toxin-antitoxin system prevent-host-death family antitoxin [Proteobacteria bacterium]|nr:type II toxin-antitoxin system prevent-host-death family antitoxin [Pseudomonadota bacterium]